MAGTLLTPTDAPATRGDRVLAVVASAACGAMLGGLFAHPFISGQVWTSKGVMAASASITAIRALRRTEAIGAARAILETVLVLIGGFATLVLLMLLAIALTSVR